MQLNNRPKRGNLRRREIHISTSCVLFSAFSSAYFIGIGKTISGGYLGVDFFFILSGFFLMQGFECKKKTFIQKNLYFNCREYLWHRLCRFYPHYITSLLFAIVVRIFVYHLKTVHDFLLDVFWEITFLQNIGLSDAKQLLNSPTWFLCSALFGSYILYYLLQRYRSFFLHFIAPFSVMFMFC